VKGSNYRLPKGMPYVRREYIHGAPQPKIAKFNMGNPKGDFQYKLSLVSLERAQIRHNALEAARLAANKTIQEAGEKNYYLVVKPYPHVVLRENKMLATAGADRLQEGMRRAFGKPVGLAARVEPGTVILELSVNHDHLELARKALKVASSKLPVKTRVVVEKVKHDNSS
jgi:large subunit ribosomal protein L10e